MPTSPGIYVTNYEMVDHFDPPTSTRSSSTVSILKQSDGKGLHAAYQNTLRRCCGGSPAPPRRRQQRPKELTTTPVPGRVLAYRKMLAAYFIPLTLTGGD